MNCVEIQSPGHVDASARQHSCETAAVWIDIAKRSSAAASMACLPDVLVV